ncbi:MAG TPA: hypothetical protein VFN65_00820 [Solirubrobacteraceae bacterium]|nr:hypothetical protein [Solirubrobacteraceae bacterium]
MRAGAIPLIVWAGVLGVLFSVHLLMTGAATGDAVDSLLYGAAVGLVVACGVISVIQRRETARPGAPEYDGAVAAVPMASLGAPLMALAFVACGFGLVFGSFLVFMAAGIFVGAVFALTREIRSERRARNVWAERGGNG